ncbi:TetR/AcrR family transcriptional regulator [Caulifigura coniformis]|nr:TetR/AcrR family transcriptional regulator [Caulifigura coniformis]
MKTIVQPTKQPAETRQRLLDEAARVILDKGLAGLTLDAVAKAAGVSKGGLLHHFPSKQHLVDGLVVDLHEQFVERWKKLVDSDPIVPGRHTRAYLKLVTSERDDHASKLCNIIAVEDRQNHTMRDLWRNFLTSLLRTENTGGVDPVTLAIVQLATDGLWLADLEGFFAGDTNLHNQIVERLAQMTTQV